MCLPFEDVLRQSDILCLHVSGSYKDKPLIGEQEIAKMKNGSWLVNCSRGGVVDEAALYEALKTGHLAGAGLDVFEEEPLPKDSPLRSMDNVLLAPHNANNSSAAWEAVHQAAIRNLFHGLSLDEPDFEGLMGEGTISG